MLSGIIVSKGIVIGKSLIIEESSILIKNKKINKKQVEKEINKFYLSRKNSVSQLKKIKNSRENDLKKESKEILNGHIMLLMDEELEKEITNTIKEKLVTSEKAIYKVINKQIKNIEKIKNKYLKERAIDINDIGKRLIKNVLNINPIKNIKKNNENFILIKKELTPSDILQFKKNKILGLITDIGSYNSHVSIIARSLSIPAIVGTNVITKYAKNNDTILLDAINNEIHINPKKKEIIKIKKIKKNYKKNKEKLEKIRLLPAITLDKFKFKIFANINNEYDLDNIKKNEIDGIGLYRTEYLFMNRNSLPDEEEQFNSYKKIVKSMKDKVVIIRTIDVGGDKKTNCIKIPKEDNPFLGWRGIRVCLDKKNILYTQLRAILRASIFGNVKILYPMITSIEEIKLLKIELEIAKNSLYKEKIPFKKNIKIGIMIETPSSAILAEYLIKEVDFFSIGTNDLIQYTLAVDRGNKMVSKLYNPLSLSVLLLIKKVIDSSHFFNKKIEMCGELAGDENFTAILIGMGLDIFSMSLSCIPKIKRIIRNIRLKEAKILFNQIISKKYHKDIFKEIKNFNKMIKYNDKI
ncbi:MAG: phosphoenolpyruvate--protein phosphotransferase [Enterobacteriaceae bacterium]